MVSDPGNAGAMTAADYARGIVEALGETHYLEAIRLAKRAQAEKMTVQAVRVHAPSNGPWYWLRINVESETSRAFALTGKVDAMMVGQLMGVMIVAFIAGVTVSEGDA